MNFQQLSNLQYWSSLFGSPWSILINIIDIALVAWILYFFTKAVAGTKIMILLRGVFLFVLGQIIANFLGLATISWLINQVITYGVIAAVVIFTPEIRTGLERLGRATDLFSATPLSSEEKLIQAFVKAVEYMSPRKIGALVAIQGSRTLQEYISTGIPLDADVSGELLINIFIPNTPLSEVSDAFTFVVSEETGGISITHNGVFKHDLSLQEFEEELRKVLAPDQPVKKGWHQRILGGHRK